MRRRSRRSDSCNGWRRSDACSRCNANAPTTPPVRPAEPMALEPIVDGQALEGHLGEERGGFEWRPFSVCNTRIAWGVRGFERGSAARLICRICMDMRDPPNPIFPHAARFSHAEEDMDACESTAQPFQHNPRRVGRLEGREWTAAAIWLSLN